jgi:hypothetical protein
VADLEARKRELEAELTDAQARATCPASRAWNEFGSLLELLDKAEDPRDARLRLRAALRRMVDAIWMLVVPRGGDRLAVAQVFFAGGHHFRSYFIVHRPPRSNGRAKKPGRWCVLSQRQPVVDESSEEYTQWGEPDLRTEAATVANGLQAYPQSLIDQLLAEWGRDVE